MGETLPQMKERLGPSLLGSLVSVSARLGTLGGQSRHLRNHPLRPGGQINARYCRHARAVAVDRWQLNAGASNTESILAQLASQVGPSRSERVGTALARFETLWMSGNVVAASA